MEKKYFAYILLNTFSYLRKTSNEKETNIELYYDRRTHLVMEVRQKTIIQMYYYDRRIHSINSNISKTKKVWHNHSGQRFRIKSQAESYCNIHHRGGEQ